MISPRKMTYPWPEAVPGYEPFFFFCLSNRDCSSSSCCCC